MRKTAKLKCADNFMPNTTGGKKIMKPLGLQAFWHAKLDLETKLVRVSADQDSSKVRPLVEANCWVGIPAGVETVENGDEVEVYDIVHTL
jgi:molybdopterin biosynthesis enzyme